MSDFLDEPAKQINTEPAATTSNLLNRLLQKKVSSGVVLPKIRSRIAKITRNSDKIRIKRLVLPGRTRRDNIKNFGETLRGNLSRNQKIDSIKAAKKQQGNWENLDMLLPNGTPMESSRSSIAQTNFSNIGIPTGGQVIAPFSPPSPTSPTSQPSPSNEPSFIERRQARLNAQEQKKTKPNLKKHDASTRLFSRVEEIIPQTTQQVKQKSEKSESKDTSVSKEKKSDTPKLDSEAVTISKEPTITSNNDRVVRRQIENEIFPAPARLDSKSIPEQKPEVTDLPADDNFQSSTKVEEDLNKLAPRKPSSFQKVEERKKSSSEAKKNDPVPTAKEAKVNEIEKKFKESTSSQIPEITPSSIEKVKSKTTPTPSQKDKLKSILENKETTKRPLKSEPLESSPTIIQRKLEKPDQSEKSDVQEPIQEFPTDKKIDFPLVTRNQSKPDDIKSISEKPSLEKPSREFLNKTEDDLSPRTKRLIPIEKTESPQDQEVDPKVVEQTLKPVITEKKKQFTQEVEEKTHPKPLEKPLVLPRFKNLTVTKEFLEHQKNKIQKVVQKIKISAPNSLKSQRISIAGKPIEIQRQIAKDSDIKKSAKKSDVRLLGIQENSQIPEGETTPLKTRQPSESVHSSDLTRIEQESKGKSFTASKKINITKRISTANTTKDKIIRKSSPIVRRQISDFPLKIQLKRPNQSNPMDKLLHPPDDAIHPNEINKLVEREKPRKIFPPLKTSTINNPPIGEKMLLTSNGRKTIQRRLHNPSSVDSIKTSESNEPTVIPVFNKESIFKKSNISEQTVRKTNGINEKRPSKDSENAYSARSQKQTKIPMIPQLIGEIELPVVRTKKVEPVEQFVKPDFAVAGPVVQRALSSASEMDNGLSISDQVEKPNLEDLAKEVYPIIKRWIAVEKERTSGRLY